jgi:hypothetical protein
MDALQRAQWAYDAAEPDYSDDEQKYTGDVIIDGPADSGFLFTFDYGVCNFVMETDEAGEIIYEGPFSGWLRIDKNKIHDNAIDIAADLWSNK